MSGVARRLGRGFLAISSWAAPSHERVAMREELGAIIDAAAFDGRPGRALLHGVSSLRTIRPAAFAADVVSGQRRRNPATWMAWSVIAAAIIFAEAALGSAGSQSSLYRLMTVLACVVLVYAALASPRSTKTGWAFIAAGAVAFLGGDLVYAASSEPVFFPSSADVLYVGMYPLLATGLLLVFRAYSTRALWPALAAAVVAGVGAAAVCWRFFTSGAIEAPLEADLVAVAYPTLDVALLVLAATLAIRVGTLRSPGALLVLGAMSLALADVGYNMALRVGNFTSGLWMDSLWLGFYAFVAAAALHAPADPSRSEQQLGMSSA